MLWRKAGRETPAAPKNHPEVSERSIAETASQFFAASIQGGFNPLGDDGQALDLAALIGTQESVVVLEGHAPVRIAVRAEHVGMRQKSRSAEDVVVADRRQPQRLHAVKKQLS